MRLQTVEGMSCTEFLYPIFQAYDFLQLHKHYGCWLQASSCTRNLWFTLHMKEWCLYTRRASLVPWSCGRSHAAWVRGYRQASSFLFQVFDWSLTPHHCVPLLARRKRPMGEHYCRLWLHQKSHRQHRPRWAYQQCHHDVTMDIIVYSMMSLINTSSIPVSHYYW